MAPALLLREARLAERCDRRGSRRGGPRRRRRRVRPDAGRRRHERDDRRDERARGEHESLLPPSSRPENHGPRLLDVHHVHVEAGLPRRSVHRRSRADHRLGHGHPGHLQEALHGERDEHRARSRLPRRRLSALVGGGDRARPGSARKRHDHHAGPPADNKCDGGLADIARRRGAMLVPRPRTQGAR